MPGDNYVCRECTVKDQCSDSCPDYHMTDSDYFYKGLQADIKQDWSDYDWIRDNYTPGEYRGCGGVWGEVW